MLTRFLSFLVPLFLSIAISAPALAAPIGSSFSVAGGNFPGSFLPTGTMTFNAAGDLGTELAPGSSNGLLVAEQFFAGAGSNGGDLFAFRFAFNRLPGVGTFGFLIEGLDIDGTQFELLDASISVDFGVSSLPLTDVTSLVDAYYLDGANFRFESPIGWSQVFAMTSPTAQFPTQVVTTFIAEIRTVPEPSSLALLAISALAFGCAGLRSKR